MFVPRVHLAVQISIRRDRESYRFADGRLARNAFGAVTRLVGRLGPLNFVGPGALSDENPSARIAPKNRDRKT